MDVVDTLNNTYAASIMETCRITDSANFIIVKKSLDRYFIARLKQLAEHAERESGDE